MTVSRRKVREPSNCSVHEAGCVSWSSVCDGEVDSNSSESEGKKAKAKASFFLVHYVGCHKKV